MTGDQADMGSRLRLTLPGSWFADSTPVLDGILAGLSLVWAGLYDLLQLVKRQSRLVTATDQFLDLASRDFFADRLPRRLGEVDGDYRARIQAAMRRERGTRAGLIAAAAEAGFTVTVFEAAQSRDTGAYSTPGALAWNVAGGWGSLAMPLECLVRTDRHPGGDEGALRRSLMQALPAGGVAWLKIES